MKENDIVYYTSLAADSETILIEGKIKHMSIDEDSDMQYASIANMRVVDSKGETISGKKGYAIKFIAEIYKTPAEAWASKEILNDERYYDYRTYLPDIVSLLQFAHDNAVFKDVYAKKAWESRVTELTGVYF